MKKTFCSLIVLALLLVPLAMAAQGNATTYKNQNTSVTVPSFDRIAALSEEVGKTLNCPRSDFHSADCPLGYKNELRRERPLYESNLTASAGTNKYIAPLITPTRTYDRRASKHKRGWGDKNDDDVGCQSEFD